MALPLLTLRLAGLLFGALLVMADDDWISKCGRCKCVWSDGRKTADCKNLGLSMIPSGMSSEVRDIDFSLNPLYELVAEAFTTVDLHDTHKLKLQNCSIITVHHNAFANLRLLIELDLSKNEIKVLDEKIFRDNTKLRVLYLNYNLITELRGNLFFNMTHLQKVQINNNRIEFVDPNIFYGDTSLKYIDLSYNRLKHIDSLLISNLEVLISLNVESNPWICDCHLQKLRDSAIKRNLITSPTLCAKPERLKDRRWADLQSRDFACIPKILYLSQGQTVQTSVNHTISCQVQGDPLPDVDWVSNSRIIGKDPHSNSQKYILSSEGKAEENIIWRNLTIVGFNHRDRGEYKCVAKNPGGDVERNLTLSSNGGGNVFGNPTSTNLFSWILGLSVGIVILLIFVCILIFLCCKRKNRRGHTKGPDMNQSSDYISLNGRPETEKPIITDVNPIVKPPRQYSVPPSVTSGATEVSDVKKVLLDNESNFAADDESRSFDFDLRVPTRFQHLLDVDYRGDNSLPPDLLSFPVRGVQISPAGSTASTVAVDHSRIPAHHAAQSPLHSPHYETIYRTLPYSRSQSPFTTPLGAPVLPSRQGYVTIPRRPRSSWSSEPPSSVISEPVYDNLGLRTSASGSSALSLNKLGISGTPKPSRSANPSASSYPCDPIAEHDSPPTAATLPRSVSAHRAVSPGYQNSTYRHGLDNSSVRSSELPDSRRESTASLLPSPDGKIVKIPPRPPPKPKKRVSTGPLFEDEGEHGTEV